MDVQKLLQAVVHFNASDLHIQVESPPSLRIHGKITPLDLPPLTQADVEALFGQLANDSLKKELNDRKSVDFSCFDAKLARFRVNAFYERGMLSMVLRHIPLEVPQLETLRLPETIAHIADAERGLVLVTGTTGSGKSTTLAALIDYLNRRRHLRILTIEDPIEFVHTSQKSLIAHREIGIDTPSFAESLRRALRQDPDFILVGELRDAETVRVALQAADTGHLVFSTMHTTNAASTVQRLTAMFPPDERETLLMELSTNLDAVICQRLAMTRDGVRVPVVEIMRATPVVRKMILEGRATSLPQAIANREAGMQLFDQHLADLHSADTISTTEALRLATNPEALTAAMRGISLSDAGLVQ